jgi:FKBP-type peptidyl-prolyl cis-trans isomerase FklB
MRYLVVILGMVTLVMGCTADSKVNLKDQSQKEAYAIGYTLGKGLKDRDVELSEEAFLKGLKDAFSTKPALSDDELQTAMVTYQDGVRLRQIEKRQGASMTNQKAGQAFLEKNAKERGVVTLPSGLQYKIITQGTGSTSPRPTQTVTVHYRGTLIDGTEFDSSYSRNEPTSFPVNRVIMGWTEALQLMTVGDKWMLYIPSELAYGAQGAGDAIGPNSTLIFEVELLKIQ